MTEANPTLAGEASGEEVREGSVTPSILQGQVEEGRVYAVYGRQEYGLPIDERELDRIDFKHAQYHALLEGRRFLAPIPENPEKILDLGCGTGIWCIDIADAYPSAEVMGVDIAPVQPEWVPPNCHFEIDDIEEPWVWKENSFDFIFARDLLLSIRDWPKLIDQCYKHLKPGGWVEIQCTSGVVGCDDGTLPAGSALRSFSDQLRAASAAYGTPIDDPDRLRGWLEARGFEAAAERVFAVPCNQWPRDTRLKLVGAYQRENLVPNLEGLTRRLFSRALGWTPEQVSVFLVGVRREVKDTALHAYWPFHVVYARKPGGPAGQ